MQVWMTSIALLKMISTGTANTQSFTYQKLLNCSYCVHRHNELSQYVERLKLVKKMLVQKVQYAVKVYKLPVGEKDVGNLVIAGVLK
jgi:hypothetical protein